MSPAHAHDPVAEARLRRRLMMAGYGLLTAGMLAALVASFLAKPERRLPPNLDIADMNNSKVYEQTVEKIGGKGAILENEAADGFRSLWSGRRLPFTLLAIGAGGAAVCFGLAYLLGLPPVEKT